MKYFLLIAFALIATVTGASVKGCQKVTSCPSQNPIWALHLPNPDDCGSFCKCDWGTAHYFSCPAGLHFNRVKQVCDWPADAGCGGGSGPVSTQPPPPTSPPPRFCTNVACPSQNPEFALHLPNPGSCTSFCKCDWGKAYYFDCPSGLHFNRVKQVCDWPADAGCGGSGLVPTQPPPPTSPPPRFCTNVACPSQNPEFALHLPNPGSCTSFCKCDWGKAYYFDCPSGLHFNRVKQVCDWPADAGCAPGPVTTTTISPPPPPPPRFCTNVACPSQNPEFALHLPNPGSCTSFCKCDWGKAYYFDCPSGLHFNRVKQVCDWPADAGCAPGPVTTTTTPPPPPPPPRFCTNVACPAQNPEFALHLPNPGKCTSFCKCDWGKAYYFDCPSGLHFNRDLSVCDWPWRANCQL